MASTKIYHIAMAPHYLLLSRLHLWLHSSHYHFSGLQSWLPSHVSSLRMKKAPVYRSSCMRVDLVGKNWILTVASSFTILYLAARSLCEQNPQWSHQQQGKIELERYAINLISRCYDCEQLNDELINSFIFLISKWTKPTKTEFYPAATDIIIPTPHN